MNKEIVAIFEQTTEKLLKQLLPLSNEQLNLVPFENSWTPAQVTDHILKAESNFPQLLDGSTKETGRSIDEKKESIRNLFLDFTTKMKSPDFILPSTEPFDKEMLLKNVKQISATITAALQSHDLSRICLDREIPVFGSLTGMEWAWFIIYHTERHIHQLENMHKQSLASNTTI